MSSTIFEQCSCLNLSRQLKTPRTTPNHPKAFQDTPNLPKLTPSSQSHRKSSQVLPEANLIKSIFLFKKSDRFRFELNKRKNSKHFDFQLNFYWICSDIATWKDIYFTLKLCYGWIQRSADVVVSVQAVIKRNYFL